MAELFRVAGNGYGEVAGSVPAYGGGAGDWVVGLGGEWVEDKVEVGGFFATKPRKLAACVEDHGDLLRRRADGEGDCEGDVVVEGELVGGFWEGPLWEGLCFEGQD